ncbi:MAG: hypothetical protein WC866_00885 [Patescibacteria group bacterium]|jgi:hypothetical protein
MSEDPRAALFRKEADAKGMTLKITGDDCLDVETRFTFALKRGTIVTSRHPTQLTGLLKLAEAVWGRMQGDHAELMLVSARREDLHPSASPANVVWQLAGTQPSRITFSTWLEDQLLLSKAVLLRGFP